MDFRQLTCFIAVAEEGQLGKAAARLCLSQPPLSRHIQALEAELGVRLFERTAAGMDLTQAGIALLDEARNIESLIQKATQKARRAGTGRSGQLKVGIYGSSIYGVVPQILRQFRLAYPEVELLLHYAQTPAQVQALRHGQVEIVFERMVPIEPDIRVQLIRREQLLVAMHMSHPLAQREWIHIGDLRHETFILGSEVTAASRVVEICRKAGFIPRLAEPSSNVVTATLLAAVGAGVTLVPASMVNVHFPEIVYRPLEADLDHSMDLHCFFLDKAPSPLLASMLETIRSF
ncbi:MAG TPA: LysR substrate-binding domain-containing protein [Variovorax sp.]|nr:LysR substrate-binding domain-containing protein [Variovorax sp.]